MVRSLLVVLVIIVFSSYSAIGQSIEIDKRIGEKNYQKVVDTYGLYNDSSMTTYINKLGQRLVSHLDSAIFDYKFFIVNDEIPNAFALPGGYIFVTRGLIPIINTEDELAGIIGHEIIHSNNRHTIRQIRKKILPTLVLLPINIAEQVVPVIGILTSPISTAENMLFASYSRKFEIEADEQGVALAARAGYDPIALTHVLNRLAETISYMTGEKEKRSYFADHPYTPDREADINTIAETLDINFTEKITKDFIQEFSGITYGKNPEKGILKDNVFTQLNKDFYIKYPKFWSVRNLDTLIVGYSPSQETVYLLGFEDNNLTPENAAKKYIKDFPEKHNNMIVKSDTIKINGVDAYIASFEEPWYTDTTFVHIIWLPIGDNIFKISTMSDINNNKTLQDITKSIRVLTEQEKKLVMVEYVTIVKAKENETIADLCERTNNKTNVEFISIINGINSKTKLKSGEEVKVILSKPYL